jgi:hypothetical protein
MTMTYQDPYATTSSAGLGQALGTPTASMSPPAASGMASATSGLGVASASQTPAQMRAANPAPPAPPRETVTERVNAILSSGGPLMERAKTDGLRAANARGLLNSSMAVGAAQDAVYKVAVPMASQEASESFQANQGALDRGQQSQMTDWQLSAQERMTADELFSREKLSGNEIASRERVSAAELTSREKLSANELAAQRQANTAQFATNMQDMYSKDFYSIMQNENLSAADRDKFVTSITTRRDKNMNLVEQIMNVDLTWGEVTDTTTTTTGTTRTTGTTSPPPPPPPPPPATGRSTSSQASGSVTVGGQPKEEWTSGGSRRN